MSLITRLLIIFLFTTIILLINVAYRAYIIPETISNMAQQIDGEVPHELLRTANDERNFVVLVSVSVVGAFAFLIMLPEIRKFKNNTNIK